MNEKNLNEVESMDVNKPIYFSIGLGINGHPMQSNIVADSQFNDWDLMQAAFTLEGSIIETLFQKGLTKEQIIQQIMNYNYYRREYLGRYVAVIAEDYDKENVEAYMDAMTEVDMLKDLEKDEAQEAAEFKLVTPNRE